MCALELVDRSAQIDGYRAPSSADPDTDGGRSVRHAPRQERPRYASVSAANPCGSVRVLSGGHAERVHTAQMGDALITALDPVLNDLGRSGVGVWLLRADSPLQSTRLGSGILQAPDGSTTGIQIDLDQTAAEQVAAVASVVQDIVVEDFILAPWPRCPVHRSGGHPLLAAVNGRDAVWTCPIDSAVIATIGDFHAW